MISVPFGNGRYILTDMISGLQMIYALRMKERILYHTCKASISYDKIIYHFAYAIYHLIKG